MKVAIIGYGVEGRSAYRYFAAKGADVTVFHKVRPSDLPEDAQVVLTERATDLRGYDVIMRSPPIRPDSIQTDGRISTVVKEFMHVVDPGQVIGVTGSKGKGTTSSLIFEILKAAGMRVHLAGNIGVPALDLLPEMHGQDYIVLELSSFQLWDLDVSPHIAVMLMMEPEHLDVHSSTDEYVQAKANIAAHQTADDVLVYLADNQLTAQAAGLGEGRKIPYMQSPGAHVENGWIVIDGHKIIGTDELGLVGVYHVQNACAAVTAAWQVTRDIPAMQSALKGFTGLPHRLQLVDEIKGVKYYDDSIATTPGSAIANLRSFEQPKVIILGGSDKGADFAELAQEIKHQNMRGIVLIGQQQDKIHQALQQASVDEQLVHLLGSQVTMTEIVQRTADIAQSGDVVIMSPACASFDMFTSYKDRGEQFIAAVRLLAKRG